MVWHALTEPMVVSEWSGLTAVRLDPDYPRPGEHALWRERSGAILHDVIVAVVPQRRLYSYLSQGPSWALEEYLLRAMGQERTQLQVNLRGRGPLAERPDMTRFTRACRALA